MELDPDKIDEAVLALLYLGLHDGLRVWKSFDWEAMTRLHEKGFITDPRSKAMSVLFTAEGRILAEALLAKLFGKQAEPAAAPDPRAKKLILGAAVAIDAILGGKGGRTGDE